MRGQAVDVGARGRRKHPTPPWGAPSLMPIVCTNTLAQLWRCLPSPLLLPPHPLAMHACAHTLMLHRALTHTHMRAHAHTHTPHKNPHTPCTHMRRMPTVTTCTWRLLGHPSLDRSGTACATSSLASRCGLRMHTHGCAGLHPARPLHPRAVLTPCHMDRPGRMPCAVPHRTVLYHWARSLPPGCVCVGGGGGSCSVRPLPVPRMPWTLGCCRSWRLGSGSCFPAPATSL